MVYEGNAPYVGKMRTEANTEAKARQNIRYRLWKEHGWRWYDAMHADVDPVKRISS